MDWKNLNTNYRYNSKHNMDKIRKAVGKLMEEDVNPTLFDFLFRYNARRYPLSSHEELELPGNFESVEDTAVFVIDDGVLQMDYAESVTPNGDFVKRKAINDVEHQTGKLTDDKVETIHNYCLYTEIHHKKPCYVTVATNHDYDKPYLNFCIEGLPLTIYLRVFNKEKVYKMLNTLSEIDYNTKQLSNREYIRFVHCIIFAKKPYAQDVIEKSAYLFASIEKISFEHQLDLHLALKMTIKYHFRGDDEKIGELLTVITKAVHKSGIDQLYGYEVEQFSNEELRAKISLLKAEGERKDDALSHKDEVISQQADALSHKDEVIFQQADALSHKDEVISQKDDALSKQKLRIEMLEKQLAVQNSK